MHRILTAKESEILCTGNSFYPLILSALAGRLNYPIYLSRELVNKTSKRPATNIRLVYIIKRQYKLSIYLSRLVNKSGVTLAATINI